MSKASEFNALLERFSTEYATSKGAHADAIAWILENQDIIASALRREEAISNKDARTEVSKVAHELDFRYEGFEDGFLIFTHNGNEQMSRDEAVKHSRILFSRLKELRSSSVNAILCESKGIRIG